MLEQYFQQQYKDLLEDLEYAKSSWDATTEDETKAEAKLELLKEMYKGIFNKEIYSNQF